MASQAPGVTKRRVTSKVKAFLDVLRQNPGIAHVEAARKAGYQHARAVAHTVRRKFPDLVAEAEAEGRKALKVSAEEAEQILASIARDPTNRDRFKAVEAYLKMHGRLSDKLQVTVDRATLNKQLDELIATMAAARQAEQQPAASLQDAEALPKN